jgi:hypothetical protein
VTGDFEDGFQLSDSIKIRKLLVAERQVASQARLTFMRPYDLFVNYLWQTYEEEDEDNLGRVITQAVTSRLPTAATRVRSQIRSCGICGGQVALGQFFSEYFCFPY